MREASSYRYRLLCPHASVGDVNQWLYAHAKGEHGLAYRVHGLEWLPIAYLDDDADAQALREAFDVEELP